MTIYHYYNVNFDPFLSKASATETALNQPGFGGKLDPTGSLGQLVGLQILSSTSSASPHTFSVRLHWADVSWGISVLVTLLSFGLSFIGD